jgi:hypothetical protein
MRKLDQFPGVASSRYPWDKILDGGAWELVHGEDFASRPTTLIANARAQARRRGGTLRTRTIIDGNRTAVIVQYVEGESGRGT